MAVKNKSLISQLAEKRDLLNFTATGSKDQALNLQAQITELNNTAAVSTKQAVAVDEALAILDKAGVDI